MCVNAALKAAMVI